MAGTALVFDILAKDRASKEFGKVGRSIDDVHDRGSRMGAGLKKVALGVGAAFAGLGVGAVVGLKSAVGEASNLGESVNAVKVVFGEAADDVLKLGENAAKTVGLSNSQFNGLAVQFSSFASKIAGPSGDVSKTLGDMTGRAADFASVMNLEVSEAASIFQSALSGETEPIKKFGIDLSAAAVEAYAAANGIGSVGKQLTESEKVTARYGLLMQETAKTQGDFANTSGSLANRQRILGATFKDIQAKIGAAVLPLLEKLAGFVLTKVIPAVQRVSANSDELVASMGALAAVISGQVWPVLKGAFGFVTAYVVPALTSMATFVARNKDFFVPFGAAIVVIIGVMKAWAAVQAVINVLLAANPIGLVVVALAALVAGLVWAYKNSETFRNIVQSAFAGVMATVNALRVAFAAAMTFIVSVLNGGGGRIGAIIRGVAAFFAERLQSMLNIARGVVNIIVGVFTGDFGRIKTGVSQAIGGVLSLVTQIPRLILNALGNLGSLLYNAGADVIRGLINGITSKIGDIGRTMKQVTDKISRFLPGSPVREGPLRVLNNGYAGKQIASMIAGGVESGRSTVASAIGSLSGTATASVGVDGSLSAQMAGRSSGGITVIVQGDVISEDRLLTKIRTGLQAQQRRGVRLNLAT